MLQKALLIGSIAALTVLLAVNLASHRPEAFFIMGWAASKAGYLDYATRMFETWIESAKTESKTKDRLRIADGSALSNSNFDKEAIWVLTREPTSATWDEKKRLESHRLLALGNARAKDSQNLEGVQRKMQLYGALVAYTGAYQLSGDDDAQSNYEIVKKMLEEQIQEEKTQNQEKEEEQKKLDSGWDSRKSSDAQEGGSKDGEKSDEKQTENAESSGKWDGQWNGSGEKENHDGDDQPKKEGEPPKSWNWTNAGNPATLQSDPGGTRGSNGSVPLSEAEREELEANIRALSELQREREKFVRPDGQAQTQNAIPNSLRELFSWDPLFDSLMPQAEMGNNGKSW